MGFKPCGIWGLSPVVYGVQTLGVQILKEAVVRT